MGLVAELRRRNVPRMAVLYLGTAWLVLQVVDLLIDRSPLPESLASITLIVLAVGFPIALILSWFYEVTPEGVALDEDTRSDAATLVAGRGLDFVVIAVLAAAVLLFAYDKWWTGSPPERSVAVLPFVNMSADEESAYFAAGVADTILNMLAQVPGLHVAARTSSFQPRLNGLGAGEIAGLLGVGAVLEGSVQRQGNRLRITAQLINAEDESHLWSRNFDREYGDVFAIQDEIAEAVTSALQLTLRSDTKHRIDREGTDNLEAFEEYSRATANLRRSTTESVLQAAQQLERALELDPDFVRAHVMLARVYGDPRYEVWSGLTIEEIVARIRQHATTALRFAPGQSTALLILARLTEDEDAQYQLFMQAIENGPNDTEVLRAYAGHLYSRKRQVDEALALSERVIRLDPLDEYNYLGLAVKQLREHEPRACLNTIARGLKKIPESVGLRDRASGCYRLIGDYSSALVSKYETLQFDPKDFWNRKHIGLLYLMSGMPDEAERWFDSAAAASPPGDPTRRVAPILLDVYHQRNDEAVFAALQRWLLEGLGSISEGFGSTETVFLEYGVRLGRIDEVLTTFEELFPEPFADPPDLEITRPPELRLLCVVGLALLKSGDVRRGEQLMRMAVESSDLAAPERADIGWWFFNGSQIAGHLALGETDAALGQLRAFTAKNKWLIGFGDLIVLRHSSMYDPIRDEPEFIELLADYEEKSAEHRRLLQALDLPIREASGF